MKKRLKKKLSKKKMTKLKIRMLEAELAVKASEAATYKDRLFTLGLDENLEYIENLPTGNVQTEIDLKPLPYGNYMASCSEIPEREIRAAKEQLTGGIVKGLMENGLVRFIYKKGSGYGPFNRFNTLAARIDVVPWERLTKRAVIFKSYQEVKAGRADGDIEKAGVE